MAENAANFTFTPQNRPSILEVIAQQSLNNTLHPAFQKIALFLSTNVPYKFGWLNKYFEETFAILNGLLQYHYLTYYDASFSENFYGLKRLTSSNETLNKKHRELSLIFLVGLPYFKRKLEEKITVIRIEQAEGALKSDLESIMKKFLLFTHSTFEFVWGVFLIHNYIKYMAQSTEYQTPIYQLIDTKLVYDRNVEDQSGFWTSLFKGSLSLSQINFGIIRNGISTTLEVGAFFLQFLQVWNSQKSNYNMTDLPNVPAPMLDNKAKKYEGKCPLCLKSWTIPTVLQVSGYIFCFRCILRHLNEHQKCPVTSLPAKPLDIVRLYIN
ncbi:peroxisome assembly protein 12 [Diorhabda carinulata]|uniref:peroxisome assembly protein 12 n=1 Tax=Diorhabda carinulata TaxID=1163345 RepID=UPI0025A1E8C3|nr:peroxisome assembly protein 12 [Diorhabda carinulata]